MQGDLKEVIGALMRALDGDATSCAEVEDLAFEAGGELQVAANRAFLTLLEYARACEAGRKPYREMRAKLQAALDEIVRCADLPRAGA